MKFKEFLKKSDKRTLNILYFIFLLGICLMTVDIFPKQKEKNETPQEQTEERDIEERMKDIFSKISGVGNVDVLIYYRSGEETVYAKDIDSRNGENTSDYQEKTVFAANSEPVAVKKKFPDIEGVLIVAEGGDNIKVKNQLIRSTQALLGVEAHKIEVLKMKS